ncbi:hypothetical protein K457DRAFT_759044 [Linnemannia elongata AG-77]|uniref:Uncharacterized protein n=1 Tax=Linnemannia elongata AG-77 TaxID=1314771 RepID=A0A197JJM2_9FUNG|nr:hypothetical protein K457DRAFT_759044 [Linnemannia elongata AG-77]
MVSFSFFSRAHLATIHYPPTVAHFSCFLFHIFYFLSLSFCQHVDAPSCSFFSNLFFAMLAYTQTNYTQFSLQEHSFTVQWRLTFPLVVDREFFNIGAPTFVSFTFFHLNITRSFFYFIFLFSYFHFFGKGRYSTLYTPLFFIGHEPATLLFTIFAHYQSNRRFYLLFFLPRSLIHSLMGDRLPSTLLFFFI